GEDVHVVDAPFVEGAVAAAVAAQTGSGVEEVIAAARSAVDVFVETPAGVPAGGPGNESVNGAVTDSVSDPANDPVSGDDGEQTAGGADAPAASDDVHTRTLTLRNSLGLHARPAAQVARMVADHDAEVTINGTPAASVLALMGLGLTG